MWLVSCTATHQGHAAPHHVEPTRHTYLLCSPFHSTISHTAHLPPTGANNITDDCFSLTHPFTNAQRPGVMAHHPHRIDQPSPGTGPASCLPAEQVLKTHGPSLPHCLQELPTPRYCCQLPLLLPPPQLLLHLLPLRRRSVPVLSATCKCRGNSSSGSNSGVWYSVHDASGVWCVWCSIIWLAST